MRTAERAIVEAIVTAVPMIDSTIEWSALPLSVMPTLIVANLPPGTNVVQTVYCDRWDVAAGAGIRIRAAAAHVGR